MARAAFPRRMICGRLAPMKTRRRPQPDRRRRVLALLASCDDGCNEALMVAHGFPAPLLAELVTDGLATAHADRIVAGGRTLNVARVKITAAGRLALNASS
jgi:hypothetical protein